MINSRYINNAEKPFYDKAISELVEMTATDGDGKPFAIAICNEENEVYRVLTSYGIRSLLAITSGLAEFGFDDRLLESMETHGGYDCIFVPTEEVESLRHSAIESSNPVDDVDGAHEQLATLTVTEREDVVLSRVGQGTFRYGLFDYWGGCAVTDCKFPALLRASHIKPWRAASNEERLDPLNGLMLVPNLDVAFDAGLITFDTNGKIVISKALPSQEAYSLRITPKLKIRNGMLKQKHQDYLEYHRKHIFLGL